MLMEKERNLIVEYGRKVSTSGLSIGTSGNVSIFDPETGYMAISPSGIDYLQITPEDVVIMKLDGTIVEGTRKPSSEHNLHAAMYEVKPDARGVIHTHSMYCTTLACMNEPIRAVHYVIGFAEDSVVPCAPYETFGSVELAKSARNTIKDIKSNALLLENHGMIACGKDLQTAFNLAATLEYVAEIQWRTMSAGKPVILDDAEMEHVIEALKSYGQKKK